MTQAQITEVDGSAAETEDVDEVDVDDLQKTFTLLQQRRAAKESGQPVPGFEPIPGSAAALEGAALEQTATRGGLFDDFAEDVEDDAGTAIVASPEQLLADARAAVRQERGVGAASEVEDPDAAPKTVRPAGAVPPQGNGGHVPASTEATATPNAVVTVVEEKKVRVIKEEKEEIHPPPPRRRQKSEEKTAAAAQTTETMPAATQQVAQTTETMPAATTRQEQLPAAAAQTETTPETQQPAPAQQQAQQPVGNGGGGGNGNATPPAPPAQAARRDWLKWALAAAIAIFFVVGGIALFMIITDDDEKGAKGDADASTTAAAEVKETAEEAKKPKKVKVAERPETVVQTTGLQLATTPLADQNSNGLLPDEYWYEYGGGPAILVPRRFPDRGEAVVDRWDCQGRPIPTIETVVSRLDGSPRTHYILQPGCTRHLLQE